MHPYVSDSEHLHRDLVMMIAISIIPRRRCSVVELINCSKHGRIVCPANFAIVTVTRRHACAVYSKLIITGRIINYRSVCLVTRCPQCQSTGNDNKIARMFPRHSVKMYIHTYVWESIWKFKCVYFRYIKKINLICAHICVMRIIYISYFKYSTLRFRICEWILHP